MANPSGYTTPFICQSLSVLFDVYNQCSRVCYDAYGKRIFIDGDLIGREPHINR